MFQSAFGEEIWLKSLRSFLSSKSDNAASSEDFFDGLQQTVDANQPGNTIKVAAAMKSWESQVGFPYITVKWQGDEIVFEQNRFTKSNELSRDLWWIPISCTFGSHSNFVDTRPALWLEGTRSATLKVDKSKPFADWIIVNLQQTGFYRVKYEKALWNRIITQLNRNFTQIHHLNRAQLIDDSFNLAEAEIVGFEDFLGVLGYLDSENEFAPWASVKRAHDKLNQLLSGSEDHQRYQKFMQKKVENFFVRFGVEIKENETRLDRFSRNIAIDLACELQLNSCLVETAEALRKSLENSVELSLDLKTTINCNGMRAAAPSTFFTFQTKLLNSKDATERQEIINGLSCTQNEALLSSLMHLAINEEISLTESERSQILLSAVDRSSSTVSIIKFLRSNQAAIKKLKLISAISSEISKHVNHESSDEFDSLLDDLVASGDLSKDQADSLKKFATSIIDWQVKTLKKFEDFFDNMDKASETPTPTTSTEKPTEPIDATIPTTTQGSGRIVLSFVLSVLMVLTIFI
jgi:aminopeptidase N